MFLKPMVLPLDETGTLYVLQDEHGREIGTGSRETCYSPMALFMPAQSPPVVSLPSLPREVERTGGKRHRRARVA